MCRPSLSLSLDVIEALLLKLLRKLLLQPLGQLPAAAVAALAAVVRAPLSVSEELVHRVTDAAPEALVCGQRMDRPPDQGVSGSSDNSMYYCAEWHPQFIESRVAHRSTPHYPARPCSTL